MIDGREIAYSLYQNLITQTKKLKKEHIVPHLAVVLVGDDASAKTYIKQKQKWAEYIGAKLSLFSFEQITKDDLAGELKKLSQDKSYHGIILQRPLPKPLQSTDFLKSITPQKDVDGFHPQSLFVPPVAMAVLKILEKICYEKNPASHFPTWLMKQKITVIGKGEAGGMPIIASFHKLQINMQVIDSKTKNPQEIMHNSDIIITAVGKKDIAQVDWIKKNAILIGVGLHLENNKLKGDYDEEKIRQKTKFYTPTPGGVGPVNVACLLQNLVEAAKRKEVRNYVL